MLTLRGPRRECRPGVCRRDVLQAGVLGMAGLTLPGLLRLQAAGAAEAAANSGEHGRVPARGKSVILIWLRGGPSHIDSYDMKPLAPAEIRGEFWPLATNVPGIQICDLLPRQAAIMDKLAIIRGIESNDLGDHTPHYILTGHPSRGVRPTIGAVTSYQRSERRSPVRRGSVFEPQPPANFSEVPAYVSTFKYDYGEAHYTGPAHAPFIPQGAGLENLRLRKELTLDRLADRRTLLRQLDTIRRDVDRSATFDGLDAFTRQAAQMLTSTKARDAFDLEREPPGTRERYGKYCETLLLARRLVEAGVPVVTLKIGDWDTHEHNFRDMREQLPKLDQGFGALVTDLHDRGLADDVAVVLWGEFGRAPRISRIAGRDHWPAAGAAVLAGGGWRMGQVIGETDGQAGRSIGQPYTPSNIFANLYRHLGIDPAATIPDPNGRPLHILDERELVHELI